MASRRRSHARRGPWDPHEREAWRLPPEVTVDHWAEANVVLPASKNEFPGPVRWDLTPHAREILHMATHDDVEELTLCCSAQSAKSLISIAIALYYLNEAGLSVAHVMPKREDAVAMNVERYQAIVDSSPTLRARLSGAKHDTTQTALRVDPAEINFLWATSPSELASRSLPVMLLDEVDKYPEAVGKESSPIYLIRHRQATFSRSKLFKLSTPTTEHGYIWQEFLQGDQRRFHVPCPLCGWFQELVFGSGAPGSPGIHVPDGERDPNKIEDEQLAWYECAGCHGKIIDAQKPWMCERGVWVPKHKKINPRTGELSGPDRSLKRLSYHISRIYMPWAKSSFSHVFAGFLRQRTTRDGLKDFRNSWLGEPWIDTVEELKEQVVLDRRKPYKLGQVPKQALALTAGIDVQQDEIWYVIRAWGYRGESWLIHCGVVHSWDQLRAILAGPWICQTRQVVVPLRVALIDYGYASRASEVLRFSRRTGVELVRGSSDKGEHHHVKTYEAPDGEDYQLHWINTDYYKGKLHTLIRTPDGQPGAWHIPEDCPAAYPQHLVAEQRVPRTDKRSGRISYVWVLPSKGTANHLLDSECYALVGGELIGADLWQGPVSLPPPITPPAEGGASPEQPEEPPQPPERKAKRRHIHRFRARFFS